MSPGDAGDWVSDVYGRLVTDGGYKLHEIDELTFEDVEPLFAHWRKHPPLRFLAEAWMGFKPAEDKPKQYMTADSVRHLKTLIDSTGIGRAG